MTKKTIIILQESMSKARLRWNGMLSAADSTMDG